MPLAPSFLYVGYKSNASKGKKQWTVARHRTMTDKNKPMNSHKTHNDDRQKKTNRTVARHRTMTTKKTMDSRKTQNDDNQKKQWTVARHRTMTTKKNNGQSQDTER